MISGARAWQSGPGGLIADLLGSCDAADYARPLPAPQPDGQAKIGGAPARAERALRLGHRMAIIPQMAEARALRRAAQ